jgi:hypothetical protein
MTDENIEYLLNLISYDDLDEYEKLEAVKEYLLDLLKNKL